MIRFSYVGKKALRNNSWNLQISKVSSRFIYNVSQKTAPYYFDNNLVKSFYIEAIIIGTHIPW